MIDESNNIKLINYGLGPDFLNIQTETKITPKGFFAACKPSQRIIKQHKIKDMIYRAPEVKEGVFYEKHSDAYLVGAIAYFMAEKRDFIKSNKSGEIHYFKKTEGYEPLNKRLSLNMREMITGLLHYDPQHRFKLGVVREALAGMTPFADVLKSKQDLSHE